MKVIVLILLTFVSLTVSAQNGKKVQFVGGARSILSNYSFETLGPEEDTVTSRKSAGGYALIDLGFKINPNASTEILGMVRVKNDLGGFWGSNVAFDVRQIYVRGVAGKIVRYQLGNIDYKLTPYTFFNHNPDMLLPGTGVLKMKEDILNYESFYTDDNTWRQQGATVDFGLAFPKVIDEVKFNTFITRMNPSNLNNIFERFYGGGNMIIEQSKYFTLGLNTASVFDLKGSAASENTFKNTVNSLTYNARIDRDNWRLGIKGENGQSSLGYFEDTSSTDDYFLNNQIYFDWKKLNLNFSVGFMDNGADFRSIGAQSKRINYGQANNFFDRYTNGQILRGLSMYDLYNDPLLYASSISTGIMDSDPSINNALPYGTASFNRSGAFASIAYKDSSDKVSAELSYYNLGELRGQGTTNLKKFNFIRSSIKLNIASIFRWKKAAAIEVAGTYEHTKRDSEVEFERISLTSGSLSMSGEFEVVNKLFLLGNVYHFESKGNELLPIRNSNDEIINFAAMQANRFENYYAAGLKFQFSEDIFLSTFYETNFNNGNGLSPYKLNQFMIIYNMKF